MILGFAAYYTSLNGQFILDDYYNIKYNKYIQNWSFLPELFTTDIGEKVAGEMYSMYRPVQMLTYMMDHSIWRLNPFGYHLTNVVLHIAAALMVCWFINILFNNKALSLFTGALFVIHPVHTEAVSYISGRADSLALIFMLFTFIFYIKQRRSNMAAPYILMMASYMLALLSREGSFIVLALLLLYDYAFKEKVSIKNFLFLIGVTAIYVILRLIINGSMIYGAYGNTLLQRLPGCFVALTTYIRLLLVPLGLHMQYGTDIHSFREPDAILGLLIFFLLIAYALMQRKNNRLVFFSISWFFISLIPVSNIYPINAYMAEHWLYLPSVGFFLILGNLLNNLCRNKKLLVWGAAAAILLSLFYLHLTIKQNRYWQDPMTFYKRTLLYAPNDSNTLVNLGFTYMESGNYDAAIPSYEKAIKADPDNIIAYNNLAVAYYQKKQYNLAVKYCDYAIANGYPVRPSLLKSLEPFREKSGSF